MSAVFQTNVINPSIATSTLTGAKCSEIFTILGNIRTTSATIEDMAASTPADGGVYQRINSDGWSVLQVWQVFAATDGSDAGTYSVLGKRPFVSTSFPTDAINTSNVFTGLTAANTYLPCPVISSSGVAPGTDSDDTTANTPPMGSHQVGSTFTFNNHGGTTADASVTLNLLSDTSTTFVGGGVLVDIRGTTEVTMIMTDSPVPHGYFIGQFIA